MVGALVIRNHGIENEIRREQFFFNKKKNVYVINKTILYVRLKRNMVVLHYLYKNSRMISHGYFSLNKKKKEGWGGGGGGGVRTKTRQKA